MKLPKYLLALTIFLSFFGTIQAQKSDATASEVFKQEKIENQLEFVITKSGRYQDYKVVKRFWLDKLKGNVIDSIKSLESKISTTNQQIIEQKATITELQESLSKTNENLTSITEEKDSMNFMGAPVTKVLYNTIMLIIIGALIMLLGLFIFKFKNSNTITIQAKKALAETETEFEDHRRRSLEREQKVMRKLQDEINKQRKAGTK